MFYTLLKAARNSGEPFITMATIVSNRLGEIITFVPLPSAIYALSYVAGTAAVDTFMTSKRHSVTQVNATNGRLRFDKFLSHYTQWNYNHYTLLAVQPTEAVLQEWLHDQIASSS